MSPQKILAASCFMFLLAGSSLGYAEEPNNTVNRLFMPSQLKWTISINNV